MNQQQVQELMKVAVDAAAVLGFEIADGCQEHLRTQLQQATLDVIPKAKRAPAITYPADPTTKWLLAKVRVAQFTVAMAADALRNGPPPDMTLHEYNFFAVLKWICPLWPVCK